MCQTQKCKVCGRELPLSDFGSSTIGRFHTCKECVRERKSAGHKKRKAEQELAEQVERTRQMRISEFTPRELMSELKRRGYEFVMKYTETHVINSKDL